MEEIALILLQEILVLEIQSGKRLSLTSGLLRLDDTREPDPTSRSHCFLPLFSGSSAAIRPSKVLIITRDLQVGSIHSQNCSHMEFIYQLFSIFNTVQLQLKSIYFANYQFNLVALPRPTRDRVEKLTSLPGCHELIYML